MNIPENLKYSKNDEWVKIEDSSATIGISDYAQDQLSDIVYLEIALNEGDEVKQGELFGTVESVKAAADLYAPLSGKVTGANTPLADSPEKINSDAYGEGWVLKLLISDPSEIEELMDAEAYAKFLEEREA